MVARILSVHSSHCVAVSGSEAVRCSFRGRGRRESSDVYPGDLVELGQRGEDFVIERVSPRKNLLIRPQVANVDQVVLVTAITRPPYDLLYIDRVLVHLEARDIDAVICINKADVEDPAEVEHLRAIYSGAGYAVAVTSAMTGDGIPSLVQAIQGANAVLAGASGVGKSRILSRLTGNDLSTGELSRLGRGRHTTKGVTLYRVGESGYLADTPGFSKLDVVECEPEQLAYYYREMTELIPLCHYPRCLHKTEDLCEVRKALAEGKIGEERYRSYLSLLEECREKGKHKYE